MESKNEIEWYLINDWEGPNNYSLYILGWLRLNALKYKVYSKMTRLELAIFIFIVGFKLVFSMK
jgi:hypothetical protein